MKVHNAAALGRSAAVCWELSKLTTVQRNAPLRTALCRCGKHTLLYEPDTTLTAELKLALMRND
jgi:hypothetical protein